MWPLGRITGSRQQSDSGFTRRQLFFPLGLRTFTGRQHLAKLAGRETWAGMGHPTERLGQAGHRG